MRRPSFPTVISLIALFVALGGTSYAVIKLPAKSVGNRELKTNAVSGSKIRPRAVSRSDLALSARTGPRGPRGAAGPVGPAGPSAAGAWKPLQLIGGWTHYGDNWPLPSYRKDAAGRVFLRGLVKRAGGLPAQGGDTIAVLPPGDRPAARTMSSAVMATSSGPTAGRLDVNTNGELAWSGGPAGDPNYTSLDNVTFWTE
jgi:hypothetical protein